ncbi:ORF25 [Leucania separata nucleopolyhedrovirus]|uniref:ORF25 n=1 Tax=Leucania separata nucleopolyhedrovirus TaxID=1307956 RepID=Q0IL94_NPVLS|nr:ORF25 [Leucania separata nucleopolyhedrovirus]AAR28789.1 ORF25 [Leucania separata nucleopolyhedrovirus]
MIVVVFECCGIELVPRDMYTEQYIKLCNCWPGSVQIVIGTEDNIDELFDVHLMTMMMGNTNDRNVFLSLYRQTGVFTHTFRDSFLCDVLVVAVNRSLMYGLDSRRTDISAGVEIIEKVSQCDPYTIFAKLYEDSCYERRMQLNQRRVSRSRHMANLLQAMTDDEHVFRAWPGSLYPTRIHITSAIERFIDRLRMFELDNETIDCIMGSRVTCDLHRLMAHRSMKFHLLFKSRGTVLGFIRAIEYDFCLNDHYNDFVHNTEFENVQRIIGERESRLFI